MQPIMIQGTGSHAGKTTLVAGLCRLFADRGLKVAPLKSQNMSLNCYVTESGEEVARSTAMQAAGARQLPVVHMNPILLKPKSDDLCQLLVHGRPIGDVSAKDYFSDDRLQGLKLDAIRTSVDYLHRHYDLIVAEGAGSCAEPNLRRLDVVNMGLAHLLGARVYVVADIDKGGVFAEFLGTLRVFELTEPRDKDLLAGFLINKFRGDPEVLRPGLDFLARETGVPVKGVLPYLHDLRLEEEDRVCERRCANPEIRIAVLYLPHISNANDFDAISLEENVEVYFVRSTRSLGRPDAVIVPGTKNTVGDLDYLRQTGLEEAVKRLAESTPIVGVCGGYQMLGRRLLDPMHVESCLGSLGGMSLLDFDVEFLPHKTVTQRRYAPAASNPFAEAGPVSGYEIHCGVVQRSACEPLYTFEGGTDGAVHPSKLIFGTFIHDIFKNSAFTRAFIDRLRHDKGLAPQGGPLPQHAANADADYTRVALALERYVGF